MINPILANAFFWRFLSQFLAVLCICAGIVTFGNDVWFDRIFFISLIFTAIFCRKNVNVVVLVAIVFSTTIIEELFYLLDGFYDYAWFKALLYSLFLVVAWLFRHDEINKYLFPTIISVCVVAEIYWYSLGYQAPRIVWYLLPYAFNLIVRFAIFMRFELVEHFFPGKEALCFSEFRVRDAHQWAIYACIAMIFEYLLRHIAKIEISVIYQIYSYAIQAIFTYILWCVLQENIIWLRERNITA